jgi:hypothetical protein
MKEITGIKERLLNSPLMLHPHMEKCPPIHAQTWLRDFWKDPNHIAEGKWGKLYFTRICILKSIREDAIGVSYMEPLTIEELPSLRETVEKDDTYRDALVSWGFAESEAQELLDDLFTL